MITHERQDYIKVIYKLEQEESPARTTTIAKALGVEPASVTGIIKRLSELELVDYEPYKGVTLTEEGRKIALEVIRNHRLIELYLIEALGYSWDEVHDEAERLEHVVSEKFQERIAAVLGYPEIDPHGEPIPTKDGQIAETSNLCLGDLKDGQTGTIQRVDDSDPGLLRYLGELGLRPGAEVHIKSVAPYGGPITITVDGSEHAIGPQAAASIFIEPPEAI